MRALLSWLFELSEIDRELSPEAAADALTRAGLEVEGIEEIGSDFDGVVVAEVVSTRPHPGADKLTVVDVQAGEGTETVVCGAPNVPAAGGRVLWARPGAQLPGNRKIEARPLRGEMSAGMLCSEEELGIGPDASGIAVVTGDVAAPAVGKRAKHALGLADYVLDLSTPANRGDVLGHVGIARELCAQLGGRLKLPDASLDGIATADLRAADLVTLDIDDPDGCPRYVARVIEGVRWGASPLWVRRRLFACGIRPIANVVDVTNYILLELGQPLHAFDAHASGGQISVRRARAGERIVTLDDQDRALAPADLAICNPEGPIAVAGVMGGKATEASESTTRILLESASFDPASIRRTARRLGLPSEASKRYERGVDPAGCELGSARAVKLFCELCGGAQAVGSVDAYPRVREPRTVSMRPARARALLGIDVETDAIAAMFARLGLEVADTSGDSLTVTCPTFRADLSREVDLIDEVIRLVGFDGIPATLPRLTETADGRSDPRPELARQALCASGMTETISYRFLSAERLASLGFAENDPRSTAVGLENPMSSEQAILRTALLPNLLAQLAKNLNHGVTDVALFEVGTVFFADGASADGLPNERQHVAGVLCGAREQWLGEAREADFFDAKGAAERVLTAVCGDFSGQVEIVTEAEPALSPHLHPGIRALIRRHGKVAERIGEIGEIHPAVRERFGIEPRCVAFELSLSDLAVPGPQKMRPIPRYPAIARDISFYVARDVPAARIAAVIAEADQPLVESARPVEDFRDPAHVAADQKGMLWSIRYRSAERTLTDAEVDSAHEAIVTRLTEVLAITRR